MPGLVWLLCLGLILLPYDDDNNIGYHSLCYSHYISVSSRSKSRSPCNRLLRSHDDHTRSFPQFNWNSTKAVPILCQAVKRIGKGRRDSLGDLDTWEWPLNQESGCYITWWFDAHKTGWYWLDCQESTCKIPPFM